MRALAAGEVAETCVLLWGAPGAGKTHLLRAAVGGGDGAWGSGDLYVGGARGAAGAWIRGASRATRSSRSTLSNPPAPEAQARLFTVFNALRERGGHLLVASRVPLAAASLRDDLRTRLGWGLVFEVTPLADADKPAALAAYARQRGFRLADDVIDYLLAHGRRDMAALLGALAALDRHSLATKRPITVPMLREWLQRNIALDR